MAPIHPQFIVDDNQRRRAVVLPLAEWEQVVEELEELDEDPPATTRPRRGRRKPFQLKRRCGRSKRTVTGDVDSQILSSAIVSGTA